MLRQAPRHSGGGGAERHRRSPHGGSGLLQSGPQRKRLHEAIQRRQLRPPDAGGIGEIIFEMEDYLQ